MTAKTWQIRAQQLLDVLKTNPCSHSFLEAIPQTNTRYYSQVREPRDLGTISEDLKADKYHELIDFVTDMRLVWKNCLQYNKEGSVLHVQAEVMRKLFGFLVSKEGVFDQYLDDEGLSDLDDNSVSEHFSSSSSQEEDGASDRSESEDAKSKENGSDSSPMSDGDDDGEESKGGRRKSSQSEAQEEDKKENEEEKHEGDTEMREDKKPEEKKKAEEKVEEKEKVTPLPESIPVQATIPPAAPEKKAELPDVDMREKKIEQPQEQKQQEKELMPMVPEDGSKMKDVEKNK